MSSAILELPVAVEIVQITERRSHRTRTVRMALEAAALSDPDFVRWYGREFASLPRLVRSHVHVHDLQAAWHARRFKDFAMLRGWIIRDLAREAIKAERRLYEGN